jgi:peroxiredoxin
MVKITGILVAIFLFFNISIGKGLSAPDFILKDENGNLVHLYEQKGKGKVLMFCKTTCRKCIALLPILRKMYKKHKDNLDFYFIFIDTVDIKTIKKTKKQWELEEIPALLRNKEILKKYRVLGSPTFFVLDKNLKIRGMFLGGKRIEKMKHILEKLSKN